MTRAVNNSILHITFLRHGESTGNAEKRHQGQADFPLTELGIDQVRKLVKHWQMKGMKFDQAISSPLTRAKQSAEIVTEELDIPLIFDQIWMERNNGELAGLHLILEGQRRFLMTWERY